MTDIPDGEIDLRQTSEQGVRLDLMLRAQKAVLTHVLPALLNAIHDVTNYMYEPDKDDEENHAYLRELATETVVDELASLLTRDGTHVSRRYTVSDVDGVAIDSLIACYSELLPENARAYFAQALRITPTRYRTLLEMLPDQMEL